MSISKAKRIAAVGELLEEARNDAKVSAFLAQELEFVEAEMYRVEYPDLKWRQFLPVKNNVPEGVETISYKVYDKYGVAKFISNYANDLPNVTVRGEKFSSTVEGMGASYQYSTQDLRAAAMANFPLDREDAEAAVESIERLMDVSAALGVPRLKMLGFLNHPNVPVDTAAAVGDENGATNSTYFVNKTPTQIVADLVALVQAQADATYDKWSPTDMIVAPSLYGYISTTPMSVDNDATILDRFLKLNASVKTVSKWHRLEAAGETGGPRIVVYAKNPRVIDAVVPMEVRQYAPQIKGLAYKVPMEARFGGVRVKAPLALRYLDGAGPVPS